MTEKLEETTEPTGAAAQAGSACSDLLGIFKTMPRDERGAVLGWFAGGSSLVVKYDGRAHVSFGKAECEWVDFSQFWLRKMIDLGWFNVTPVHKFIAKGMKGQPNATEYSIHATELGSKVREDYWAEWDKKMQDA